VEEEFSAKHRAIVKKIENLLWSEEDRFYMNIHCPLQDGEADYAREDSRFKCREPWGYTPWYFGLAPQGREDAFGLLDDPSCFAGKYGLCTADRSHRGFGIFYDARDFNAWLSSRDQKPGGNKTHECLWNGPSWPFSTSITLSALARSRRPDDGLFFKLLKQYAASHRLKPRLKPAEGDKSPFWIDENMNPDTGDWISRTHLMYWSDNGGWDQGKGGPERGKDYNHSTFCDLVISGLFGLRISYTGTLAAHPCFPPDWNYAALRRIPFRGKLCTIQFRNGKLCILQE
jgi:hypothetical protein